MARLISVCAPSGARRRAGFDFGPEAVHIDADELSHEQVEAIVSDPQLVMVEGAGAVDPDAATAANDEATSILEKARKEADDLIAAAKLEAEKITSDAATDTTKAQSAEKPAKK